MEEEVLSQTKIKKIEKFKAITGTKSKFFSNMNFIQF